MKNLFVVALALVILSSCKSKVCECADIHIKAVKEINKVSDPVQKMKVLSAKKYQVPFEKCNKMTESMTPFFIVILGLIFFKNKEKYGLEYLAV